MSGLADSEKISIIEREAGRVKSLLATTPSAKSAVAQVLILKLKFEDYWGSIQ